MKTLPIMLKLVDQQALVVGAGSIGLRRVESLLNAGAKVRLVTGENFQQNSEQFENIKNNDNCEIVISNYYKVHLNDCSIVFACTDNRLINTEISKQARQEGILVNAADQNDDCDFYMPAIVQDKDVVVAIGTGGQAPALTGLLRRRVEKALPDRIGDFASLIDEYRQDLKQSEPDSKKRMEIMKKLCDEKTLDEYRTGRHRGVRFRYALAVSGQLDQPVSKTPAKVSGHPVLGTSKLFFLGLFALALPFLLLDNWANNQLISKIGHIVFSVAGYLGLAVSAWFGFKYISQAAKLREKNPQAILSPSVSLETLDTRCRRILHAAFVLLTASIGIGFFIVTNKEEQNWYTSVFAGTKLLGAFLAWIFALIACVATFSQKFKAQLIAKLTILSFIIATILSGLIIFKLL